MLIYVHRVLVATCIPVQCINFFLLIFTKVLSLVARTVGYISVFIQHSWRVVWRGLQYISAVITTLVVVVIVIIIIIRALLDTDKQSLTVIDVCHCFVESAEILNHWLQPTVVAFITVLTCWILNAGESRRRWAAMSLSSSRTALLKYTVYVWYGSVC